MRAKPLRSKGDDNDDDTPQPCRHTNTTISGHIETCNDCGASWNVS